MTDPLAIYAIVCLAAFAAGIVNTLAGGGTLLTFPVLLLAGASAGVNETVANVTSTVALLPGSVAGAWGLRRELHASRPWIRLLIGPSLVGGVLGALLLVAFPNNVFKGLVPWLVLTAAVLFLLQPFLSRLIVGTGTDTEPAGMAQLGLVAFQFAVAVYGGYFGAGIGILMLSALGFMGMGDIRHMNAVKNLLAVGINGVTVVVFVIDGRVVWRFALMMAMASIAGGLCGAQLGRRLPRAMVRGIVIAIGFGVAVYFFVAQR